MKIFESCSSSAFSSACSTPKKLWKSAAAPQSRTCWWVDIHEQRDGLTSRTLCGKKYSKAHSRLGKTGLDQDWRYWVPPPWLNVRWKGDRTDWWAKVLANLFLWCPFVCSGFSGSPGSQDPRILSLCCSESEGSIDGELNSENSLQLQLVFFLSHVLPIEIRCTAHCH